MPLLRKTGVRSPFLPGPILGSAAAPADMLRQTIVIGAIVPTLLLGGIAQPVSARPLSPNTDSARPTTVVQDAPDATLAQPNVAWVGRLPRDAPVVQADRVAPAAVIVNSPPLSGALLWKPEVPRQPGVYLLRPTQVRGPPQPLIPASLWKPEAARLPSTERLRTAGLFVWTPPVPIPGTSVTTVGVAHPEPASDPLIKTPTLVTLASSGVGSAVLAGNGVGSALLAANGVGAVLLASDGVGRATLANDGQGAVVLTNDGRGTATVN